MLCPQNRTLSWVGSGVRVKKSLGNAASPSPGSLLNCRCVARAEAQCLRVAVALGALQAIEADWLVEVG